MREAQRLKYLSAAETVPVVKEKSSNQKTSATLGRRAQSPLEQKLELAGINMSARVYALLSGLVCLVLSLLAYKLGLLLSLFVLFITTKFLFSSYLEERALKRERKVTPQLAPFIDGLASALSTGFNLEGAFAQAAQGVPPGILRDELDKAVNSLNQGFSVREASSSLNQRVSGKEVTSLVVALGLFSSMGGSVLDPFRRLARKIREQQTITERANRDLVLVRQAFNIILFLALAAPMALVFVQPDYLNVALADALGSLMIQIGAALVIGAIFVFRRLVSVRI